MIVVALILAAEVDAVDQAHINLLRLLDVDQVTEDLQSVGLRELLKDEGRLLLVLAQHLGHEGTA